jgi:hypothetical protein
MSPVVSSSALPTTRNGRLTSAEDDQEILYEYGQLDELSEPHYLIKRYGLDGPGVESRWGAKFSSPVQTGPGAHPASYTVGTVSFPGVKRPGRGVDHPPTSSAEVKERVELYYYSPYGPLWPVVG